MMNYNGGYNPYQTLMQQAQQPLQQPLQTQGNYYKAIPVTNKSEANSVIPSPTGEPILFINKASNEVYLKQIDTNTGIGIFQEYILKPIEEEKPKKTDDKEYKALSAKLDEIKTILEKGVKNAK